MVGFMIKISIFNVFNVRLCSWGQMNRIYLFLPQEYLFIIDIWGICVSTSQQLPNTFEENFNIKYEYYD